MALGCVGPRTFVRSSKAAEALKHSVPTYALSRRRERRVASVAGSVTYMQMQMHTHAQTEERGTEKKNQRVRHRTSVFDHHDCCASPF